MSDTDGLEKKPNPIRRLYDWTLSLAERRTASAWLAGISFAEASFFPIPPDVLLIPLCLGAVRKALKFALICSIASILGGIAGYCIGAFAWDNAQDFFYRYVPGFSPEGYLKVEAWYAEWGWAIVFLAGFSPIPYKIFTIAAGVVEMNFPLFLLASAVSRSARFFLVAILIAKFGEPMKVFIDRHFNKLALLFGLLLLGGFALLRYIR